MAQLLVQPDGRVIDVDREFMDGGAPPKYGLMGGERVLIAEGTQPKPAIYQRDGAFFFADLSPVTEPVHVDWLPEPYRAQALEYVAAQAGNTGRAPNGKARAKRVLPPTRATAIRPRTATPEKRKFDPVEALGRQAMAPQPAGVPEAFTV